jgi:hypothetical protein
MPIRHKRSAAEVELLIVARGGMWIFGVVIA